MATSGEGKRAMTSAKFDAFRVQAADVDEHPNLTFFRLRYQSLTRSSFSNDGVAMSMRLLDVLEPLCARGFLRQTTRLSLTSKVVAAALPMGTGKQIYEAAKAGRDEQLTVYLEYWRGNAESCEVLNWAPSLTRELVAIYMSFSMPPSRYYDSPLLAAARNDRLACVKLLAALAPHVDVNTPNVEFEQIEDGGRPVSALHWACRLGRPAMVRVLLAVPGIVVNRMMTRNVRTRTMNRCRDQNIEKTPLHEAAQRGHAEIVRLLLAAKGNSSSWCSMIIQLKGKDTTMRTPLQLAREGGHHEVVAILAEAIEKMRAVCDAGLRLWNAVLVEDIVELRSLLEKWTGNKDVLNWDGFKGRTPMHVSVCVEDNLEVVKLLASTPCIDIDRADLNGWSPFGISVQRGNIEIVRFFLSLNGVDLNRRSTDEQKITALGVASLRRSHDTDEIWAVRQEIAALLRAAGAEE